MVAFLQKSQMRVLNSIVLPWYSGTNLKDSHSETFFEFEPFSFAWHPFFQAMSWSYHHKHKISKLQHGFWGRICVWWLGREGSSLLISTLSCNCYQFLLKHTFISLYFLSISPLTNLLILSFLFFCSRTEARFSFETTSAKNKDCLISFEVFPGLRSPLLKRLATDLHGFKWSVSFFCFFFFIWGTHWRSVALLIFKAFFSSSNSAIIFVKVIVASSFSLLGGFSSFGKLHCNKKGWRFWRR